MAHEQFRKRRLFVEEPNYCRFLQLHDGALRNRNGGRHSQSLSRQASFEIAIAQNGDDCFLSLFGDDGGKLRFHEELRPLAKPSPFAALCGKASRARPSNREARRRTPSALAVERPPGDQLACVVRVRVRQPI